MRCGAKKKRTGSRTMNALTRRDMRTVVASISGSKIRWMRNTSKKKRDIIVKFY